MKPRRGPAQIAVVGGGRCGTRTAAVARALGRELARAGAIVLCGGRGGVMAAVARGAREADGTVVGILPGYRRGAGNRWLTIALPTGLGHARNVLVVAAADAVIALPGASGTLSEVALAGVLRRPVVALGAWRDVAGLVQAHDAQEAARRAVELARVRPSARARAR